MSYLDQFAPQQQTMQAQPATMAPGAGGMTPQQMQMMIQMLQGGTTGSAGSATPAGGASSVMQGIMQGSKDGMFKDQIKGMFGPANNGIGSVAAGTPWSGG